MRILLAVMSIVLMSSMALAQDDDSFLEPYTVPDYSTVPATPDPNIYYSPTHERLRVAPGGMDTSDLIRAEQRDSILSPIQPLPSTYPDIDSLQGADKETYFSTTYGELRQAPAGVDARDVQRAELLDSLLFDAIQNQENDLLDD